MFGHPELLHSLHEKCRKSPLAGAVLDSTTLWEYLQIDNSAYWIQWQLEGAPRSHEKLVEGIDSIMWA